MRFPLGYGILLVLILGLVSIQPLSCYVNEENETKSELERTTAQKVSAENANKQDIATIRPATDLASAQQVEQSAGDSNEADEGTPELIDQSSVEESDGSSVQAKRNLGMPASSRDLSVVPEGISSPNQATSSESSSSSSSNNNKKETEQGGNRQDPSSSNSAIEYSSKPVNEPANGSGLHLSAQQGEQLPSDVAGNNKPISTARGMMSSLTGASSNANQQANNQAPPNQVRHEDLPTIIENNRPVKPQASLNNQDGSNNQANQPQASDSSSLPVGSQVSSQLSQQESSKQQQQQQQQTNQNGTLPTSSARTFDSWTNCVGAASNKYGTCKNDVECGKSKGTADGSCMGGLGVCCIVALSCGDKSFENNTFFANSDYPEPSWEARLCEVELKKKHHKILQIMIEFVEFELAPPNHEGECITDVFQVKLGSNKPSPYSLLRVCGQNTGQHLYLDVSQIDEPLLLSVATSGGGFPRRWSIRIVQMDEHNRLLAPPGCLQYYTDTIGHFRSFNLGRNLKNLYYAICFRIDNGYSGIRFTENFFGMNGPFCRKKIGGGSGFGGHPGPFLGPGRYNNSGIVAHPHHLVIPPPGYGAPLPRPHHPHEQQYMPQMSLYSSPPPPQPYAVQPVLPQQQQPITRYRRLAYLEPVDRQQRTLHEHEHDKEHEGHHKHPHHGPPVIHGGFGGDQGPHGQQHAFQHPPPPHGGYGYDGPKGHEFKDKVDDKFFINKHHPHESHHHEHESKSWGWNNAFGWVGAKKDDKFDKFEHEKYGKHSGYGDYGQSYGQSYGGYGPGGYSKGGYGHPGYGKQHYGGYHHKEIDKFGEKYEHLEYKHEKNHSGKDKEVKSSWWPSWGAAKKEEKKMEKFQQHHEALFPMIHIPEMPHCEPRFCGTNDVITFPPSGDSIAEMCGNRFNRGRGPKIISGSPLVVYVSNRGHSRGAGFDMNYEQVFYIPRPY